MREAVVLSLSLLIATIGSAAVLPVGVVAQSAPAYRAEWTADTFHTWRGDDDQPRVQFNLRAGAGDSRWGFGIRLRDLVGLPPAAVANVANDVQFSWTREPGTFRFLGSFDNGRGAGTYTFTPDQTFVTSMASAGYRNLSSDQIVRLAVVDVTLSHVRGLAQAAYNSLPIEEVVRTRIHQVTPEFIRDLAALGYKGVPVESLIRMAIHGATPENIRALQAQGIRSLSVEELIKFRIHKVTPDFIRSMRDPGFKDVSEEQLVRMRIHNVDAMFVRHAREDGLSVATPGDAVDLAIHGPRRRRR